MDNNAANASVINSSSVMTAKNMQKTNVKDKVIKIIVQVLLY